MRILKSHPILSLVNSYMVDSPQPANISYMWNFGSLLGLCLIIQILTGIFLAMHYSPNVDLAFASVEHIMRDVNYGWAVRYTHANTASFFFICVYLHIARGLYYGSYRSPRTLTWSIGVIIFILMMAIICGLIDCTSNYWSTDLNCPSGLLLLPFVAPRIRGINRIGPHNKIPLDILICGLLGDWWADLIPSINTPSVRFQIEQGDKNLDYLKDLSTTLYNFGYTNSSEPKLVPKSYQGKIWANYRLTTFSYSNLVWIYSEFYPVPGGIKVVPSWIETYLSPVGLAHWIMQDGSRQKGQGLNLATNSFTYQECLFLANILSKKYHLTTSVVKTGREGQWRISVWKESMPKLAKIVGVYIHPSMDRKLQDYV